MMLLHRRSELVVVYGRILFYPQAFFSALLQKHNMHLHLYTNCKKNKKTKLLGTKHASRDNLSVDGFFIRTCAHRLHSTPRTPGQTGARVFPLEAIPRTAGEVTPGVHFKAPRARVPAVWNKVQHTAAHLWNGRRRRMMCGSRSHSAAAPPPSSVSEFTRTTAESRPGPPPALEALDGALPQQLVSPVALHLTSGPQSAPVAAPTRRVAGGLPVGQSHRVAPKRVCAPKHQRLRWLPSDAWFLFRWIQLI